MSSSYSTIVFAEKFGFKAAHLLVDYCMEIYSYIADTNR